MENRIRALKHKFLESPRHVDVERAVIITEVHRENEDKPPIIRRALSLEALLSRMSIGIREGELIVGNHAKEIRGVPLFPEYAVDWILEQMDTFPTRIGDRFQITEDQKRLLREILPYWRGKCLRDAVKGATPSFLLDMVADGVFTNENYTMSGPGHMVPNHAIVLNFGFNQLKEKCQKYLNTLCSTDSDYKDKYNFYKACSIVCDALSAFAYRYADRAVELASYEDNKDRRKELFRIAENCRRIPIEPARDFWDALQRIYFLQVAIQLEANGLAIALGRLDQTLYPYYKQDIASGLFNRAQILELLECFYLKLSEIDKIYSNEATRFLQGPAHGQTITLAGVNADGKDATNELSYLFLEADREIRLVQPDLAVRVHRTLPGEFLKEVCINIKEGLTKPKLFNDEVVIQSLLSIGFNLEDARNWAALGCSEPVAPGKTNSWGNSGHLNLAKCLELALNDGTCMLTQKRMGLSTGDPSKFSTFEGLLDAFKKQVRYFVKHLVTYDNIIDRCHAEVAPLSLYSLVIDDCLDKGREFNGGGARYNTTSPLGVGPITTGDSLAAIKTLVYQERLLPISDLVSVLRMNFEGQEAIRQMLINRAPKFGNDEDIVDELCNEVLRIFCDELIMYKNPRNGPFIGALYYLTANVPFGQKTAASADGRKSGEPLNDGGISPTHGRDKRGPTAVAKSVGKLDHVRVPHGSILNQTLHPSLLEGEEKIELFSRFVRTFMDLGGWHIQFNVLTTDSLREAQKKPEEYRGLVVRVAGYSAYFVELAEEVQNDIIARTEQKSY